MVSLDTHLIPNPGLLATAVGDEAVMMHVELGRYFTLNPVASEVWEGIVKGQTIAAICAALAERYDAPQTQIEEEVKTFAALLVERGLATVA